MSCSPHHQIRDHDTKSCSPASNTRDTKSCRALHITGFETTTPSYALLIPISESKTSCRAPHIIGSETTIPSRALLISIPETRHHVVLSIFQDPRPTLCRALRIPISETTTSCHVIHVPGFETTTNTPCSLHSSNKDYDTISNPQDK